MSTKQIILICGPGASGKDEVAKWLKVNTPLKYNHSTSHVAAPHIYKDICDGKLPGMPAYESVNECYADRILHRVKWADWIDNYNLTSETGARLYQESVSSGNQILTGIRKLRELRACKQHGLCDLAIWIDRDVPFDPTMEYDSSYCDLVIDNHGRLTDLHAKLYRLVSFFNNMFHRPQHA